ncbi:type II secretion system protein GspL [Colwellia sp. Arc7-D]|jgi:general secretion pathway protein L|uniref:type II secretion system protein GspL n=1 Tax=Colwellia sp. Arc7-D TaxID=2161872 RepID=UPI000D3B403D|nr:type II secretion system protein GspL [Colwellia sp. Arc7-D]AWB56489.1 type II secretion system protein GspL [Colwellia sp. Arc7-D]|tara:strand:+ start:364 stop:1596 length:1233 start_codon:yes stop_codon:yes gene_type:complete
MGETLFIRLGSQAESRIHWLIKTNGQEDIIASGELPNAGELTQLTEKSTTRDVVVFVPASDIAIKRLKVPGSSQRATRAAAPYMLEEMLAQDVEEMCFAFSETKQDDQGHNCFVAALERKQLDTWLQWLAEAEIFSKVLIPDALALPVEPNISSAVMLGEQVLIRLGEWQVMSFEANAWPVVANYFQGLSEDSQVINAYSALSEVPADLTIEYLPEDLPLAILANNHSRKFNLLQGEFQVKEKRSADTVNWLWVAGIACLALVLNFGLKGAELYSLSSQQAVIETEIIEKYKTVFPETKRVRISTVRSQLRQKLAEVGDSDDVAGFLALLVKLEPALASVPEIKPQTLKFDGKRQEVRMQTIAKDYQYFEKLKVAFEKAGLAVNLGAQNNQGDQISGSFSITDTSSKGRS